jgi:predicted TIM-barrel fold metal-dependent hydrolase
LCHTGGERTLPNLNTDVEDPALLVPALERGVTVIAAHCGTRDRLSHRDHTSTFYRLAREYERLYGDTAALNLPQRSYAYDTLLTDQVFRAKLVHGSDWPIPSIPPRRIGMLKATRLLFFPIPTGCDATWPSSDDSTSATITGTAPRVYCV